jgi:hypothetical protein
MSYIATYDFETNRIEAVIAGSTFEYTPKRLNGDLSYAFSRVLVDAGVDDGEMKVHRKGDNMHLWTVKSIHNFAKFSLSESDQDWFQCCEIC